MERPADLFAGPPLLYPATHITDARMAEVTIYTTLYCPYCIRAKALLNGKRVAYQEIDLSDDPEERSRLVERTGRRTVPQVFINGEAVGGYEELAALDRAGKLDTLLAGG